MYVDTHIHLTHKLFDGQVPCITSAGQKDENGNIKEIEYYGRDGLVSAFQDMGIGFIVEPGIDFASNEKILGFAKEHPDYVLPAIGVHPTRSPQTAYRLRHEVKKMAKDDSVVAIGELGLDYHYERKDQHRLKQKMWFRWQLKLAGKLGLPLILHIRLADDDVIKILRKYKKHIHGGVCHCFVRGRKYSKIYTEEFGFMLGIGGSLLQDNCSELEETVRETPLEYLVLETDGPYVKPSKPEHFTGKKWQKLRNTSFIIPDVAARIAELKGISIEEVERVTTENAIRLFKKSN